MLEKIKKQYQTDGASKLERYHQLIVFKIEQQEYALPIDQVKEVVITPSIAKAVSYTHLTLPTKA
jgi:chemotaxis signal transduction protein